MKILVCDDEYATRLLTKAHLKMLGIEVDEASGGLEALKFLKEDSYDAVIVDYSMPAMDGMELIEKIGGKIPTLILTSEGFTNETERQLKNMSVGYMVKPVTEEKLKNELVEIFGEKIINEQSS
ncbi:MAG: response regulator [Elusimicrobia bacterium]|nr:response regulator [Elusimicrobiota bacterium]